MKKKYNFKGQHIQISPNNFWEESSLVNMPLSSVLSEILAAELSKSGAIIQVQEAGENSLRLVGTYTVMEKNVLVTLRLRRMGPENSLDLAVANERICKALLSPSWLVPEFDRMARSLVQRLETNFEGTDALSLSVTAFQPGAPSQPSLVFGEKIQTDMKDALSSSAFFRDAGTNRADAVLKGDYVQNGREMVFRVFIAEKKTGRRLTGTRLAVCVNMIPEPLMKPCLQTLEGLIGQLTNQLMDQIHTKTDPALDRIFIGRTAVWDQGLRAVTPLARKIQNTLVGHISGQWHAGVTDNPRMAHAGLMITGQYTRENRDLLLTLEIAHRESETAGCRLTTLASAQGRLGLSYIEKACPEKTDIQGHIDYLLAALEKEAMPNLSCQNKHQVMIHKLRLENKKEYCKFSDYLDQYITNAFASSRYFEPVEEPRKKLTRALTRGTRTIMPSPSAEAVMASAVQADCFLSGSFWPGSDGNIEVRAKISELSGRVLASEQVILARPEVNEAWLRSEKAKTAVPFPVKDLAVELFTQKGQNNLTFKKGEKITFFIRTAKPAYIRIFDLDVQNRVFQIYPNDYEGHNRRLAAGEIAAIPNDNYPADFEFQVFPPAGQELVLAVASDQPLPELPGSITVTNGYGMKQVTKTIGQIKAWYDEYARKRGFSVSWDILPVLTRK